MSETRITRRNRLFIQEYIKTKNGTEAVRRVYPNIKNPEVYASVLLRKDKIKEVLEEYFKRLDISNEDIIKDLTEIAKNGKVEANRIRCYELLAKIKGLLKDIANQQVTLFNSDMLKSLPSINRVSQREETKQDIETQPVDNSKTDTNNCNTLIDNKL